MNARVISMLLSVCVFLHMDAAASEEVHLIHFYSNPEINTDFCTNNQLKGSLVHVATFNFWISEVARVPKGPTTLQKIVASGHSLRIVHAEHARVPAGRTLAPMTENLITGRDESAEIRFDARVIESGSHLVYNSRRELVEYTAVQNLFHELVHAKHKMNGTWRYFDSEEQQYKKRTCSGSSWPARERGQPRSARGEPGFR